MKAKIFSTIYTRVIAIAAFSMIIVTIFSGTGFSRNWDWDQNHDCTEAKKGDGNWGRYDYDGNFTKNTYSSKKCCELLCKICPVYANTGRYQKTFIDLIVPGVGPALQITRTYNSQEWSSSLLGYSWHFNFGRKLIISRDKTGEKRIGVLLGTGEKNYYREDLDGTLTRITEYGANYELIKSGSNTYTIRYKNGTWYEIRADGKIEKIIDKNQNEMVFAYDTVGCLSRITNASGNYVDFTLGANGKIASVSDNLGRTIAYAYDNNGNLISVTDPIGNVSRYVYNSNNYMVKIIDARGNTIEAVAYDSHQPPRVSSFVEKGEIYTIAYFDGRTEKTDSHGNKWTYYFTDIGVIERVVDPLGNEKKQQLNKVTATSMDWEEDLNKNRTTYTYDDYGNIVSKTDPLGNTWTYTYITGTDLLETEIDPLGRITSFEYDSNGSQISIIRDSGGSLENRINYTYDEKGNQTSITGPLGTTTYYEYDINGNVILVRDSLGGLTSYTYDNRGNRLSETSALQKTTTFSYDLLDRLVTVTDPISNTIHYTYDANGNLISILLPNGNGITFEYDQYNRVTESSDPLGNSNLYTYDENDNLLTETDANGYTTYYIYDALGRKIGVTNSENYTTTYSYDANGNLTSIMDANNNLTTFIYDSLNRITKKIYSDGNFYSFSYDALGNKIKQIDPNGNKIDYTYDRLNRLIRKSYPDGTTANFWYDKSSRLIKSSNPESELDYIYDSLGRITQSIQNGKSILYSYDSIGNRISMTTPEGETVQYSYNDGNLMTGYQLSNGKGINYTYDSIGRIIKKDYSGGLYTNLNFDNSGRLIGIDHMKSDGTKIYQQQNIFDNIVNIISKINDIGTTNYSYDRIYQLKHVDHPIQNDEIFNYDPVGNRIYSADYDNWAYNNRNQLTSYGTKSFVYDSNGNTIREIHGSQTTEYVYNFENRLIRINFPDGDYAEFKYDTKGRRIEKNTNGIIFKYLWDKKSLIAEYDASDNLIQNYFYGYGDINPSLIIKDTSLYWTFDDHLNTPQKVVSETGDIVWDAQYKSFGETNILNEDYSIKFRFPGQYADIYSGLYYNINRYFDSRIGRYLNEDPLEADKYTYSLYVYAKNNPIRYIDPLGLEVYMCKRPLDLPWWVPIACRAFFNPLLCQAFESHARHCYIKISSLNETWGFDGNVNSPDPNPTGVCAPATGGGNEQDCQDKCVHDKASQSNPPDYNFFTHNCCHWARNTISKCGLKNPYPNVNWPFNPGP
ncbi:MAG: RHS repeat protein [Desulfobacterales bacterium]|nr:RHS repeat protein [Desulfobacterales bacterium]